MTNGKGHFSGLVMEMDDSTALITVTGVFDAAGVKAGEEILALTSAFMEQMPMPSAGSYVEGNIEEDPVTGHIRLINIVRPV